MLSHSVRLYAAAFLVAMLLLGSCASEETVSPTVSGPGAGPTATQPAQAPTSAPTSTSAPTVSSPNATSPATDEPGPPTLVPKVQEDARRGYLTLFLLDASVVLVDEIASQVQSGEMDGLEGLGSLLVVGALLQAVDEALLEPAPIDALGDAWVEAQIAIPLLRGVVGDWMDEEIGSVDVPKRLEPARRQVDRVMALANEAMADQVGYRSEDLETLRQEAMADLRASLAATPEPGASRTEDETTTSGAQATVAVEIKDIRWTKDFVGDLVFIGEVINTGDVAASDVKVTVTLLADNGKILSTDTGSTLLSLVGPGDIAPFRVDFMDDPGAFAEFEAIAQAEPAGSYMLAVIHPQFGLTRESDGDMDDGTYSLVCEAVNDGEEPATSVKAIITAYDADGQVIGVGSDYAEQDTVLPGQPATFNISTSIIGEVVTHTICFEGRVSGAEDLVELEITGLNRVEDYFGDPFFVGEITNHSSDAVSSASVAITVNSPAGELLATDSGGSLLDVIPPGATAPFRVSFWHGDVPEESETVSTVEGKVAAQYVLHNNYKQFELVEHSLRSSEGDFRVVGQVRNVGDREAHYVKVIVTGYDAEGNVVAVDSGSTELDRLEPGGTSPFEVDTFTAVPVADYKIQVEGSPVN